MSIVQTLSQTVSSSPQHLRLDATPVSPDSDRAVKMPHLFAAIPPSDLVEILSAARKATYYAGQTIFFTGEKVQRVVLLEDGTVKITRIDESGSAVILQLVGPGEVVGPLERSRIVEHVSTAEARTTCKALAWEMPAFEILSKRFPLLQVNATHILAECLQRLETRFCEISTKKVSQRLACELARLLPQVGRKVGADEVEINLSQEELAQMTATTQFTVSRHLTVWEQKGVVSLQRLRLLVRNLNTLVTISEFEQSDGSYSPKRS